MVPITLCLIPLIEISNLKLRMLINGIVLGAVISFSGMSILMFAGFVELFTNVEDIMKDREEIFLHNRKCNYLIFYRVAIE